MPSMLRSAEHGKERNSSNGGWDEEEQKGDIKITVILVCDKC